MGGYNGGDFNAGGGGVGLGYGAQANARSGGGGGNSGWNLPTWWNQNQVNGWYRDLLGRPEVNPEAMFGGRATNGNYGMEHAPAARSMDDVYNIIYGSAEGKAYRSRQSQQATPPEEASPVTGDGLPNQATSFVEGGMGQAQGIADRYAAERREIPTYGGYNYKVNVPDWAKPNTGMTESSVQALVDRLLANPYSMDANTVAAMKEAQKADSLVMMQQRMDPMMHDARMRGVNTQPVEMAANQGLMETLMGGYRDIDIRKALQDREDEYNAVNTGNTWMDSQWGRASQDLSNRLATSEFDLKRQQAEQADAIARWQSQAGSAASWNDTAAELARISSGSLAQQLALQQFLEQIRQFNASQRNQFNLEKFRASQYPVR